MESGPAEPQGQTGKVTEAAAEEEEEGRSEGCCQRESVQSGFGVMCSLVQREGTVSRTRVSVSTSAEDVSW